MYIKIGRTCNNAIDATRISVSTKNDMKVLIHNGPKSSYNTSHHSERSFWPGEKEASMHADYFHKHRNTSGKDLLKRGT